MYKFVASINKARQATQGWSHDYVERYVMDNFFAYSFGDMLVLTTNSQSRQDVTITYLPYTAGTTVCNAFDSNDCLTVSDQGLEIGAFQSVSKVNLRSISLKEVVTLALVLLLLKKSTLSE